MIVRETVRSRTRMESIDLLGRQQEDTTFSLIKLQMTLSDKGYNLIKRKMGCGNGREGEKG